jgi:hypothetical protein
VADGGGRLAWFAWIPVSHRAGLPTACLGVLILDAVLVAVFVTGLEGAVLGMVPLRFMDGHKVTRWSRIWVGFGLFSFAFWGYFRFRKPREAGFEMQPEPVTTPDEP